MKKIIEYTDEELVALAQKNLAKYNKALSEAKEIAMEYGFEINEQHNNVLNIIFAKLKEKREKDKEKQLLIAGNKWYKNTLNIIYKRDYSSFLELVSLRKTDNSNAFIEKLIEITTKLNIPCNFEDYITPSGRTVTTCLRVTFPNGHIICHRKSVDTLVEVIETIGPEKVAELDMNGCGIPFLTQEYLVSSVDSRSRRQNAVAGGWYVSTNTSNQKKKEQIDYISSALNLGLTVEIVEKDSAS